MNTNINKIILFVACFFTQNLFGQSIDGNKFAISIGTNELQIPRFNDDNVIAKNKVEYYPESDVIKNINDIEPEDAILKYFKKPFQNINTNILKDFKPKLKESNLKIILEEFKITLSEKQISTIEKVPNYKNIRIYNDSLSLYLYTINNSIFEIFLIEIMQENDKYESSLPINTKRIEFLSQFNKPNFETTDSNVYIYSSFKTMKQINIFWNNNKINKIQYIIWNGI